MISKLKLLGACLGAALGSANTYAAFISFETAPDGAAIVAEVGLTNQFASLGVVFSAAENGVAVTPTIQSPSVFFGELAFSGTNFANNQIAGFGPSDSINRADVFTMSFLGQASGVSFYVDPNGSADPVFNAYSADNSLLETITVNVDGWNLYSFASSGIARIEGIQPTDSWNYGIDDLTFTLNRVPEPGALALLGLSFAGLAATRRRKQ